MEWMDKLQQCLLFFFHSAYGRYIHNFSHIPYLSFYTYYIHIYIYTHTHIYFFFLADWSASQDTDWECQVSIFLFPLTCCREIRPKGSPLKVLWEVFVFWERETETCTERESFLVSWLPLTFCFYVLLCACVNMWSLQFGPMRWQNRERKPTQWGQLKGKL